MLSYFMYAVGNLRSRMEEFRVARVRDVVELFELESALISVGPCPISKL